MIPVIAAVAAIVPSMLLLWYFRSRDENPEPGHVVWKTFALGAVAVIPVVIVALPLAMLGKDLGDPYAQGAYEAFFTAAIPEEFFKFVVLWFYAARHKEFDEPMDGIVYGATASLGFATLENVLYVGQGGLGVALLRAFTAVPGHAFTGAIMGAYVGRARFELKGQRGGLLAAAFFWPMLLHGLYDFPLLTLKTMQKSGDAYGEIQGILVVGTLAALIVEWVWTVRVTRRMRREQLADIAAAAEAAAQAAAQAQATADPQASSATPTFAAAPAFGAAPAFAPAQASGAAPTFIPSPAFAPNGAPRPLRRRATLQHEKPPTRRGFLGWFQLLFGALLASSSGLMTLAMAVSAAQGDIDNLSVGVIITTIAIVGVLPLALGIWLFVRGLRRRVR